jgi:hypothetical protein
MNSAVKKPYCSSLSVNTKCLSARRFCCKRLESEGVSHNLFRSITLSHSPYKFYTKRKKIELKMICAEDTRNKSQDISVDILGEASMIALSRCDDGEEPPNKKQKTTPSKESPTVSDSEVDEVEPSSNSQAITSNYNDKDVLSGRGGGTNLHSGNRYYRELIFNHRETYDEASKANKPNVSRKIVKMVRDSGGRFLRKDGQGLYHDIGNTSAREKTSQALRHRTFEMRNIEEGKKSDAKKESHEDADTECLEAKKKDADTEFLKAKKNLDGIKKSGGGAADSFFLAASDSEGGSAAGRSPDGGLQKASLHASLREKVYMESTMRMKMMEFELFQQARAESEFNSLHMVRAREHAMAREAHQLRELQDSRLRNEASEMNEAIAMIHRREAVLAEEAEILRMQRIALQMEASAAPVRSMPMLDPRARFAPYGSSTRVGENPHLFYHF